MMMTSKYPWLAVLGLVLASVVAAAVPARAGKEPKKRVAVTGFENRSNIQQVHGQQVGEGLAELLITGLIESGKFIVLERLALEDVLKELDLSQKGLTQPTSTGRLTAAQILVRGTITSIDHSEERGGGMAVRGFAVDNSKSNTRIGVNLRLVDTITGQVIFSRMLYGEVGKTGMIGDLRSKFKKFRGHGEAKSQESIGLALEGLVNEAVEAVVEGMDKIPWQGQVVKVSGREVYVNAGRQESVDPGMRLIVFERGQDLVDPETNESLGREDREIGLIEITKIGDKYSIGRVLDGQGFKRGDVVRPEPDSLSDLGVSLEPTR